MLQLENPEYLREYHNQNCSLSERLEDDIVQGMKLYIPSSQEICEINKKIRAENRSFYDFPVDGKFPFDFTLWKGTYQITQAAYSGDILLTKYENKVRLDFDGIKNGNYHFLFSAFDFMKDEAVSETKADTLARMCMEQIYPIQYILDAEGKIVDVKLTKKLEDIVPELDSIKNFFPDQYSSDGKLAVFFIENPLFFIQQGTQYHETTLLASIFPQLDELLVKKSFFKDQIAEINLQNGQLFLIPGKEKEFGEAFQRKISEFSTEECIFSPSLYTGWKNKTINFIDISPLFGEELLTKLNISEKNYFKRNILGALNNYIINSEKKDALSSAIVNDPDGFTNLRKDKNTSSEILQKVKSGEYIEILDEGGD